MQVINLKIVSISNGRFDKEIPARSHDSVHVLLPQTSVPLFKRQRTCLIAVGQKQLEDTDLSSRFIVLVADKEQK